MDIGICDHINDITLGVAEELFDFGINTAPRGNQTKELINLSASLLSVHNRMTTLPFRKFSLAYAIGELTWYLSASNDLEHMKYYALQYSNFSDNGESLYGAYGPRIFRKRGDRRSQWHQAIETLLKDSDSRQAVISIYNPDDAGRTTKDMPCTLNFQLMIRNESLHWITNMRSNDLWLGTPYDIFCFTMMQEIMADKLNVQPGIYSHHVGSWHLYDRNFERMRKIVRLKPKLDSLKIFTMPPIKQGESDLFVSNLLSMESNVRSMGYEQAEDAIMGELKSWHHNPGRLFDADLLKFFSLALLWKRLKSDIRSDQASLNFTRQQLQDSLGDIFTNCFN